jgi:pyrroloquinoline quinone biosynthesis protein B
MRVKVLGSAAGGGFPQWNCGCPNCSRLRVGVLKARSRTQAQVAVSPSKSTWLLLNASPDLKQQLLGDSEFAPTQGMRGTPIAAVVLTSADVDCVLGLLHLREFQPLHVYATASVRRLLTEENTLFRTLERSHPPVCWEVLPFDHAIPIFEQVASGAEPSLFCKAVRLGRDFPDYVSDRLRRSLSEEEAVIGLELVQDGKRLFYAPSLPGGGQDWKRSTAESDLALLDGTFWTDDEFIRVLGSGKTATQMGHLPLSGSNGLLEQLRGARDVRRVLIHLNNTNPALDEESEASRALRAAGWEVAYDGMEFEL